VRHPEAVSRLVFVLCAVALAGAAAVSAASPPKTALLTAVKAAPKQVEFRFRSAPLHVKAGYVPRSKVVESGSGWPVKVAGSAFLVIRFTPASGADLSGKTMRIVYKGPTRLKPATAGPVREVARTSDFESDLAWVIGLDRRRPYHVARDGSKVVVTVG
jgi:hypothetical protein